MNTSFESVRLGGLVTACVTREDLAQEMVADCQRARAGTLATPRLVFSSNGQGISLAGTDPAFMTAMAQADIIHADGMSVVFASRLARNRLPERIATTDFFHDAARAAAGPGLRFFMLGASEAQNRKAVERIRALYPQLEICGSHHGYFDESQDEDICRRVRESRADVLWVALGKPRQEYWSVRNRANLGGVGWVKTCGGLYAFLAGDAPRAPRWMQKLGLEWLYRTLQEPSRLGWRYLLTNPHAAWRLLWHTDR